MENDKSRCDFSVFQAAAEGRTAGNAQGIWCVKGKEIMVFGQTELPGTLSSHLTTIRLQDRSRVKLLKTA